MKDYYKHLFEPIEIGNMVVPNRICHVPTDIGASYSNGEASDRDVFHHSQLAKGGTGLVIVGATTPEMAIENAKAGDWELTAAEVKTIDDNYKRIFEL